MMKKRIEILLLIIVLLVSTTGLPTYIHNCLKMNETSTEVCNSCSNQAGQNGKGCCGESVFNNMISVDSDYSDCCQINFAYHKVDDTYIFSKDNFSNLYLQEFLTPLSILSPKQFVDKQIIYFQSNSPPFAEETYIYILNSNFRI